MVLAEPLDEELFRMPAKTEHFAVTRLELFLVHGRRLIRARLALAGGRGPARFHFRGLTRVLHLFAPRVTGRGTSWLIRGLTFRCHPLLLVLRRLLLLLLTILLRADGDGEPQPNCCN